MNKEENMEREMDDSFLDDKFKANPFSVPEGYFTNLEEQILAVSKLPSDGNEKSFTIPIGYFEDMNAKILAQVKLPAAEQHGFEVPDLYFENLSANIVEKTKKSASAKVIRFSFLKYAAAAMLLLTTTFGAYLYNKDHTTVSQKLATIPEDEIADYLKFYTDPNDVSLIIESTDDFSLLEENFNKNINN